ncbi:MAG: tetratricopeptide repeat protein [Planctomycetota bacterium]|nr:tetratricopeptide repeat protein [Planctomycetota bacterium]
MAGLLDARQAMSLENSPHRTPAGPAWAARILFALLLAAHAAPLARGGEDADFRRAQSLYTRHEYEMAVEELGKYLARFPDSERAAEARLLLAESCYQLRRYEQAAQQFDAYLKAAPKSPRRPQALQRALKSHYQNKAYEPTLERAESFLREYPKPVSEGETLVPAELHEHVLYYAGEAAYALKRGADAVRYWERLLKEFPDSKLRPDASEGLGWAAFEAGDFAAAQARFSVCAAAAGHPKAPRSGLMVARCLAKQNKVDEALAALPQGLPEEDGLAREAAYWRAAFLIDAKKFKEALPALGALAAKHAQHPDTEPLASQAAFAAYEAGRFDDALALAEAYLKSMRGPARPAVLRAGARALLALKRDGEARAAAEEALKESEALQDPERRAVECPAALLLHGELAAGEAEASYRKLLESYPQSREAPLASYRLALELGKRKAFPDALKQAEALLAQLDEQPEQAELRRLALFAAAEFAFWKEDYAAAEDHLTRYAALPDVAGDPAKFEADLVALRLAWCRFKAGDAAGAVKRLDAPAAKFATPAREAEALYLRGLAKLKLGQADAALAEFKALVEQAPPAAYAADACHAAAEHLVLAKRFADALPWLDRLLETQAFAESALRADGLLMRAQARLGEGRTQDALADAEALLKRQGAGARAPAALLLKALSLDALPGKEDAAEAAYAALLEAAPDGAPEARQGRLNRARLRFGRKRFAEAKADLEAYLGAGELMAEDAPRVEAAVLLALCLKESQDAAGARARLERLNALALSGKPAFEVPFQLGNLEYDAGRPAAAAPHYRKALDAAAKIDGLPGEALAAAWLNLAWSYKLDKKAQEAEAAFAKAGEAAPGGAHAREAAHQRALLAAEAGNLESALGLWNALLAKEPAEPLGEQARLALATAQAKAGRFADAAASFLAFQQRYPKSPSAREVWAGLGECRLQTRDPEGAKAAFLEALGEQGAEAELDAVGERALLGLAELALGRGEAAETKKLALRVVIDRPDSRWLDAALYLSGKACEELGEPERAIAYFRELVQKRPESARAAAARERLKALGAPAAEK